MNYIKIAQKVLDIEAMSLIDMKKNINSDFDKAVELILQTSGKVIVTGMGKSGHIGTKIAASFASTGTPSFFLHPSEAFHGDLGMISKEDIVIAIANSGETDEILRLIPFIVDNGIDIISITSNASSTLAKNSSVHLCTGPFVEACPLRLAPTTSTTLTLAMGDAIMVALMEGRKFKENDYAQYHPGGSLGKRLLSKVSDYLSSNDIPLINSDSSMIECVYSINAGRVGLCIVGSKQEVLGIITDGDLRRAMEIHERAFFDLSPLDIMSSNPIFIEPDAKLVKAQRDMLDKRITSLLVGDKLNVVGIIQLQDINI